MTIKSMMIDPRAQPLLLGLGSSAPTDVERTHLQVKAIAHARDFDNDGVPNDVDNCPAAPMAIKRNSRM